MQHSTKIHARNKDSEVQKHVRYMEQQLETIEDKKYNVQDMMIDNNVEYEMVGESVNIRKQKTERYQELIDWLKGCLEDLLEKKETEIRKKEDQMQQQRFKRRMEKKLKIEEMKLEMKQNNEGNKIWGYISGLIPILEPILNRDW